MPKYTASKKADWNIIDRVRFFLIKLLAGQDLQVMANTDFVNGSAILDKTAYVFNCAFRWDEQGE